MSTTPSIRYSAFIQAVRRYRPSDLLTALAGLDSKFSKAEITPERDMSITPWGIALIARESILHGDENRTQIDLGEDDIRGLHRILDNTYDGPQVNSDVSDTATGMLFRIGFEQFPYQESDFEEFTRSVALFRIALESMSEPTLTSTQVDTLLDVPLEEGITAAVVLYCILHGTSGVWSDSYFDEPQLAELFEYVPRAAVKSLRLQLTARQELLKSHYEEVALASPVPEHLARYGYNPLNKYPLIELPNGKIVSPQPRLILWRMSITSLAYIGSEKFADFFSNLGDVVEAYVGQLLNLTEDAEIRGSIPWGPKAHDGESTDWFFILPDCVVLIEVKSARVSVSVRAGSENLVEDLKVPLNKARKQLNATHKKLLENHSGLDFVPRDRPIIGLIVTAGSIRTINGSEITGQLLQCDFPVLTISLRELEFATPRASSELGEAIKKIALDPKLRTWALSTSLGEFVEYRDNEILDRASARLPVLALQIGDS